MAGASEWGGACRTKSGAKVFWLRFFAYAWPSAYCGLRLDGEELAISMAKDLREIELIGMGGDDLVGARQRSVQGVVIFIRAFGQVGGEEHHLLVAQVRVGEPPPAPAVVQRVARL